MVELTKWKADSRGFIQDGTGGMNPIPAIYTEDKYSIISVSLYDGKVTIAEDCDGNYGVTMTPADAITALQEAIDWIKERTDGV